MTNRQLRIAMWVPGLFWLFPVWLRRLSFEDVIKPMDGLIVLHGIYTALQILALLVSGFVFAAAGK